MNPPRVTARIHRQEAGRAEEHAQRLASGRILCGLQQHFAQAREAHSDARDEVRPGHLRLLQEANPIGFVIEQAGKQPATPSGLSGHLISFFSRIGQWRRAMSLPLSSRRTDSAGFFS